MDVVATISPNSIDVGSFLAIVVTGAIAGTVAAIAQSRGLLLPSVVLELVLGILIGPQVLGIAHPGDFVEFFAELGLGMLFFFAGYEIDESAASRFASPRSDGPSRSSSRTRSGACSPGWAWCSPCSTRAQPSRRPRSGP
jgi:hypothetical protein